MKIMIMGHAGHGKDTVCEMLERHGYAWASSSEFMCENVVYPALKEKYNYESPEQCHADRNDHREEWYQLISDFNAPDRTALAQAIYAYNDIYCGIRHAEEYSAIKASGLFDYAIWVDAADRLPSEPETSCTVTKEMAHFVIDNNGTLEDLALNVTQSIRRLEYENDKKRLNEKMKYYPAMTSGPGFTVFWHDEFTLPASTKRQNGALPVDVIDAVIHRLGAIQSTSLATAQNEDALDYLRAASLTIKSAGCDGRLKAVS